MRLSQFELHSIKQSFTSTFQTGTLYLFGSRIDDTRKGGDIDLYICSDDTNKVKKKLSFLVKLKRLIGEQKIDVVLSYDTTKPIEVEAYQNGILLCKI
jgi:predicted nucleotidyltransferase